MSHFAIACLQLAISNGNNLEQIAQSIASTKKRFPWVEMLVLPELCAFGTDIQNAEILPGNAEAFLCDLAKQHQVWLVAGSLFERSGQAVFNTCPVIDPDGQVRSRYRKIYPFYPYERGVTSGDQFVVVDTGKGKFGIAICYDLWFPEVARALVSQGAECIIYPTLTGTIDREQELTLAKATAIQNQCYVICVNCAGELGNGRSIIVGPEGEAIYTAGEQAEIIPVEIDFSRVTRTRERGLYGLGQPLKSFRDNPVVFPQYSAEQSESSALSQLGELSMPTQQGSKTNDD